MYIHVISLCVSCVSAHVMILEIHDRFVSVFIGRYYRGGSTICVCVLLIWVVSSRLNDHTNIDLTDIY